MKGFAISVLMIAWGVSAVAQNCQQSSARAIFLGEKGAIAPCPAPGKTSVAPSARGPAVSASTNSKATSTSPVAIPVAARTNDATTNATKSQAQISFFSP